MPPKYVTAPRPLPEDCIHEPHWGTRSLFQRLVSGFIRTFTELRCSFIVQTGSGCQSWCRRRMQMMQFLVWSSSQRRLFLINQCRRSPFTEQHRRHWMKFIILCWLANVLSCVGLENYPWRNPIDRLYANIDFYRALLWQLCPSVHPFVCPTLRRNGSTFQQSVTSNVFRTSNEIIFIHSIK